MKMRLLIVFAVILGGAAIAAQSAPTSRARVQGVWRIAEFAHYTEPTNSRPQPSLYLFTGRHYAMLRVTSSAPRVAPVDPDRASAAELLAVWGNNGFIANAGTYEIEGEHLIIRPVVAKDPGVMTSDFYTVYAMRFEGDLLVLSEVRDTKKIAPYPTTFKLSRLE